VVEIGYGHGLAGVDQRMQLRLVEIGAEDEPAGVVVQATVTLGSSAVVAPATIKLLENTSAKADLALVSPQSGLQAQYAGSYVPGATPDGSVSLRAVAAYGTPDATASTAVTVMVDQTAPAITAPTLTCDATPCRRDSKLTVSANVTDLHLASVTAQVTFPAPVGPVPVTLTATSGTYSATLDLESPSPFPFFSQGVSATFTATDQGGNASQAATTSLTVTRLRWATAVESASPPSVTGAAVDASGASYVGGANGKLYVVGAGGMVNHAWQVGTSFVAAPAVGTGGVWIGGQDWNVYLVNPATGVVLNGTGCPTGGPVTATPAVAQFAVETAFVGSQIGRLFAVAAPNKCTNSDAYEAFYAAAAIDGANNVYAASDQGRLRSLRLDVSGFFVPSWTAPPGYASVGASIRAPLALNGAIWSASYETTGQIYSTTSAGVATPFAAGGSLADTVLLSNGDVVVGDGNVLRRWTAAGTVVWASPNLGAAVVSAMAIASGDASFLVPTADGKIHALKADGSVLWEGPLTAGSALREGNIFKLSGDAFSTAVFGAADGKVYGVLVDGQLDASAPWPKVHHDPRNTGNASTPLP